MPFALVRPSLRKTHSYENLDYQANLHWSHETYQRKKGKVNSIKLQAPAVTAGLKMEAACA
jgi:hypothetical protein